MLHRRPDGTYEESPIHGWFALSYANYFVMPRLALEAMPVDWQARFIALFEEMEAAGMECPTYIVLRKGEPYSREVRCDDQDEQSSLESVDVGRDDPWANYRHGDASDLCPTFKVPA